MIEDFAPYEVVSDAMDNLRLEEEHQEDLSSDATESIGAKKRNANVPLHTNKVGSADRGASTALMSTPHIHDLLTIIITTSPIKSHPSTDLLEKTMESFRWGGTEFFTCPKLIICDGVRQKSDNNSGVQKTKRYVNTKQAMRNGIVNGEQYKNYVAYKKALHVLCQKANLMPTDNAVRTTDYVDSATDSAVADDHLNSISPFINTKVVELETRHGYGFAFRHAVGLVETPYVCVIQHDRTFMRTTPMAEAVRAMHAQPDRIKYVGLTQRSNLMYRDIFGSKFMMQNELAKNREKMSDFDSLVMFPPELRLPKTEYGPDDSKSMRDMFREECNHLRHNLLALAETYAKGSHGEHLRAAIQRIQQQQQQQQQQPKNHPANGILAVDTHPVALVPTFFWYDNTHICETAHYRDFILHPDHKMVARGGFVEDKTSPAIRAAVARDGVVAAHAQFRCFLMDDASGYFFTGHMDGGSFMTQAVTEALVQEKMKQNKR